MVVTFWDVIAISCRKKRGEFCPGIRNKGDVQVFPYFLTSAGISPLRWGDLIHLN